ncbi:MAG TPA: dienelactone hydrolase family protein [Thermoanaerobaculia bacterium]
MHPMLIFLAAVLSITFPSSKGGVVPAYLVRGAARIPARRPAVIFMHWGLGDRHAFLDDALTLSNYGVTSLLIDAPFNRPNGPKDENEDLLQAVADVRKGVDLLSARNDVDPKRIGFVGLSYGAHVGALLAAQEPRFRALVLAGGLASNSEAEKNPALAPYDAEKWINKPHTAPIFLQFARNDEYISRAQADRFIKAASDPAVFKWYEGNHQFNAAARADRSSWLATELGFTIPDPAYRAVDRASPPFEIAKLGVVTDMPGMQHVTVKRDIAFSTDQKMDVYYPFGMTPKDRVPAIITVSGQARSKEFMKALRQMRFATTFAQALAVRTNRIIVMPDIRSESQGDPAKDLGELIAFLVAHADELQIDASALAIFSRSAGYSYGLRAANAANVKAFVAWYPVMSIDSKPSMPALIVTAEHDEDYDAAKVAQLGDVKHIHLPDGDHGFEIIDDLEQSRDAFVQSATFLRQLLPIRRSPD